MTGPRVAGAVKTKFVGVNGGTTTTTSKRKVVETDVIFVNNGGAVGNGIQAGSAGGDGTAENPIDSINGGANLVQTQLGGKGTVYVQESGNTYGETVIVDSSGFSTGEPRTPVARITPGRPPRSFSHQVSNRLLLARVIRLEAIRPGLK